MIDPFTQVYDALWSLAETPRVTSLVRVGNRIKLDSTPPTAGLKDQISQADVPELVLALTATSGNWLGTSSSSSFIRQYQWQVSSGDMKPSRLLALEWALNCAMVNWPSVLAALTWYGEPFVKRAQLVSAEHGESDPERNRGIRGWSALWTAEVEMHFRTRDMLAYNLGTGTGSGT